MTEEMLRKAIWEAHERGQQGLFIWADWSVWDWWGDETKPGNENYDYAISKISIDKEAVISIFYNGFAIPCFVAVSVRKLRVSDELIKNILKFCEKNHHYGPIEFIPSNEVFS